MLCPRVTLVQYRGGLGRDLKEAADDFMINGRASDQTSVFR